MENEKTHYSIEVEEGQLNSLFKEILDGVRDDINEAQENVNALYEKLNDPKSSAGFEIWGDAYHESLRVKGSARERQLKFLSLFKDRVSTKEKTESDENKKKGEWGNIPTTEELNKALKDMIKQKEEMKENAIVKMTGNMKKEEIEEEDLSVETNMNFENENEDDFIGNFEDDD